MLDSFWWKNFQLIAKVNISCMVIIWCLYLWPWRLNLLDMDHQSAYTYTYNVWRLYVEGQSRFKFCYNPSKNNIPPNLLICGHKNKCYLVNNSKSLVYVNVKHYFNICFDVFFFSFPYFHISMIYFKPRISNKGVNLWKWP